LSVGRDIELDEGGVRRVQTAIGADENGIGIALSVGVCATEKALKVRMVQR